MTENSSTQEKEGAGVLCGDPAFGSSAFLSRISVPHYSSRYSASRGNRFYTSSAGWVPSWFPTPQNINLPVSSKRSELPTIKVPRPSFHHVVHLERQVRSLVSSRQWGKKSLPSPKWNEWRTALFQQLDCGFSNDFSWLLIGCYCWKGTHGCILPQSVTSFSSKERLHTFKTPHKKKRKIRDNHRIFQLGPEAVSKAAAGPNEHVRNLTCCLQFRTETP